MGDCAGDMGRLQNGSRWLLVELKRELQQFDAQKKEWKS